ncbi:hypothetical protein SVIOM342S_03582 [Streptomyces violaceorubidus]
MSPNAKAGSSLFFSPVYDNPPGVSSPGTDTVRLWSLGVERTIERTARPPAEC